MVQVDLLVFDLEIQMACEPIVKEGLFNITSGLQLEFIKKGK
jgi:hypothetical protein